MNYNEIDKQDLIGLHKTLTEDYKELTTKYNELNAIHDKLNQIHTTQNELLTVAHKNIVQICYSGITSQQKVTLLENPTKSIQTTVKQQLSIYRKGMNLFGNTKKSWFSKKPTQTKIILETLDRLWLDEDEEDKYPELLECINGTHYIRQKYSAQHEWLQDLFLIDIYSDLELTAGLKNEYYIYKYIFKEGLCPFDGDSLLGPLAEKINNYVYYGQTIDKDRRHGEHFNMNKKDPTPKDEIFGRFGPENFVYDVVKVILSKEEMNKLERTLFQGTPRTFNNLHNIKDLVHYDDSMSDPMMLAYELSEHIFHEPLEQ